MFGQWCEFLVPHGVWVSTHEVIRPPQSVVAELLHLDAKGDTPVYGWNDLAWSSQLDIHRFLFLAVGRPALRADCHQGSGALWALETLTLNRTKTYRSSLLTEHLGPLLFGLVTAG